MGCRGVAAADLSRSGSSTAWLSRQLKSVCEEGLSHSADSYQQAVWARAAAACVALLLTGAMLHAGPAHASVMGCALIDTQAMLVWNEIDILLS